MSTVTRARIGVCSLVAIAALPCGAGARAQTTPAAPGTLRVTASSETSLSLRWKDRSRHEAYYKVRVAGRARRLAADRQALTVTGLQPGVTYRVAVQACSSSGRCSRSVTDTATTAAEPLPLPPPSTPAATIDVTGTVTVTTGNCMPTIGGARNRPDPCDTGPAAGARVLLYAPALTAQELRGTFLSDPPPPSAQATTDASGRYRLLAEPGTYSFLVDTGSGPECGRFDADWFACPHALLAPRQTVDLRLDHASW